MKRKEQDKKEKNKSIDQDVINFLIKIKFMFHFI